MAFVRCRAHQDLRRRGRSAEDAQRLGASTETVRNHIRSLLRKLEVHGKLEALALVLGRGRGTGTDARPALRPSRRKLLKVNRLR